MTAVCVIDFSIYSAHFYRSIPSMTMRLLQCQRGQQSAACGAFGNNRTSSRASSRRGTVTRVAQTRNLEGEVTITPTTSAANVLEAYRTPRQLDDFTFKRWGACNFCTVARCSPHMPALVPTYLRTSPSTCARSLNHTGSLLYSLFFRGTPVDVPVQPAHIRPLCVVRLSAVDAVVIDGGRDCDGGVRVREQRRAGV